MPFEEPKNEDPVVVAFPQNQHRLDFIMGDGEQLTKSEDCHFLSIYTPSRAGQYPVLVWIHGGAYMTGSGEEAAYDECTCRRRGHRRCDRVIQIGSLWLPVQSTGRTPKSWIEGPNGSTKVGP